MEYLIVDNMKKESRVYLVFTILSCVVSIALTIGNIVVNDIHVETLLTLALWFALATFFLYGWLHTFFYEFKVTQEKIFAKTPFKKMEVCFAEIEKFSCSQYKKSVFYQFKLFTKDKTYIVSTRFRDKMQAMLFEANIPRTD